MSRLSQRKDGRLGQYDAARDAEPVVKEKRTSACFLGDIDIARGTH
jgi:hypothetical protein